MFLANTQAASHGGGAGGRGEAARERRKRGRWSGVLRAASKRLGVMVVVAVMATAAAAWGQEDEDVRLGEQEQLELEHLLEDLRDEDLDLERRRRAAQILLTRDWAEATGALRLDLVRDADVGTQRAVAQAIAAVDLPDGDLMQPLMDLLGTEDAELRRDVAAALGRFDDGQLMERLMRIAREGGASEAERLGAIEALAQHRQPEVVELLLEIVAAEEAEAWQVRATAFDALARLSGVHALATDVEGWQQWWQRAKALTPRQWQASLLQNLSNRNADLAKQVQVTRDRLVSAQNRLYDATAESDRPAMLQQMLEDPMEDLRLLALQLIERRVLNAQTVGDAVRQVMRERLADRVAAVRAQSAAVLATLADVEAAELATNLLFTERSRRVQAAYLALMARVPTAEAVEPALWLMQEERVSAAAADCLRAAFDAGLMSEAQVARARQEAKQQLVDEGVVDRAMLRLLARVGERDDLAILTEHLRNDDSAVRLTAARGFRQTQWPLEPLLDVIDDSTLAPVVIEVAERRGQTLATMEHLLDNEPGADANGLADAWRAALTAVAARLDAEAVAALDEKLADADRSALHEQLLSAAATLEADAWDDDVAAGRVEAALRLGRLYVEREQFAEAARVYSWLRERGGTLAAEPRQRLALGRTTMMLQQGEVEEAATLNREMLEQETAGADALVGVWLDVAEQRLNGGGDREAARMLVDTAAELFEDHAGDGSRSRLSTLRQQLQEEQAATAEEA